VNVQSAWRGYWFKDTPYFDLAFLRILLVGLQCFLMLSKTFGELSYVVGLDDMLYSPLLVFRFLMSPWGAHMRPDADWMNVIFWLTLACGGFSFFGLLTNLSMILFAVGNIFIQSYIYSFGDFHHPEAVMMIALLAFALSPCGKVLSIDGAIRKRRVVGTAPVVYLLDYCGPYAGWPIKFMQWFFPLMYLSAITAKMGHGSLDWANGFTLQYYMVHDSLRKGGDLALALAFSRHHDLIAFGQMVVLVFQATFFLVVPFPKLRWIYLPIGLLFHFGNYWILAADFPQWIGLYAVFIPWSRVFRWVATARVVSDRTDLRPVSR